MLERTTMKRPRIWCLCLALVIPLASGCGTAAAAAPSVGEQLDFGVQMARRGLWDEAHFRFLQAQRLDPGNPKVVNNLAVAAEATGRFDEALELYREALRLSPNNRELRRNFSRFIEFYQGLNPEGETEEDAEGTVSDAEEEGSPSPL
jgi:tetratricopeptide (TPR) repeat protein